MYAESPTHGCLLDTKCVQELVHTLFVATCVKKLETLCGLYILFWILVVIDSYHVKGT